MTAANQNAIENGNTVLGIEFGSTRIKAVLLDKENKTIATGSYSWENSYIDDIWTYSLDEIWEGLQVSYKNLVKKVKEIYGVEITRIASIGFSAMMHGYLAFDEDDSLLVPFRTWRNNITEEASEKLTKLFEYPIPQRWSIAHLYQSILNGEEHVSKLKYMTTLAGYVHWKLSGEKVLGVGDASGMFPIDIKTASFNKQMFNQFDKLVESQNFEWKIEDIMPQTLKAGENAGTLTKEGAKLLDPTGTLEAGSLMCPPEGDAETGMVATNSVAPRTGNVSAGTSVFAMVVLEDELSKPHPELDLVMTPTGKLVAMAHSNNCSSNLDKWINVFKEAIEELGFEVEINNLYETLYNKALEGDKDCGGLLAYGYLSGEHITGFEEGRPLFTMESDNNFNLANFMRVNLQSALGAMKMGMDILLKEENVKLDKMLGHGGLFKTEGVAQKFMAAAVNAPVSVMETAGEGGAWGIALLASYHLNREENQTLEDFLNQYIFTGQSEQVIKPDPEDVQGFEEFMKRYKAGLSIERAAVENLN
ncbi:xylulokinase [Halanaerobium sp. ST460_2HS_T2]|uniref:xylulokinase n=1 Tax=Halanaerobium sp. ST460_2HS_T2 TaxID=2183914 RepID=UPI000DF361D0|nr:FGGY-family carbohydrate kinase [Halanaerobium sp. ST460_2HS_T2]RCW61906.1 sugar (pentulose or hexulose) kinase [Halanaerobium sp. ST460_2HS_T2]